MYLPWLLLLSLDLDMHSSVVLQAAKEGVHTCDFPLVFLEKAMWAGLSEYAPPVAQLMQRFFLEESVTLEIEGMMEKEKLGVVSAACKWMKTIKNQPVWEAWLPPSQYRVECELGEVVVGESCKPCPHGTFSNDNYGTKCLQCAAGDMP
jgi:hypothetical protein